MENNLYRIEVVAHDNLPKIDTTGMLLTNEGIAYVTIHPVRINATPKANAAESEELEFVRKFIHEHGLEFALASAWERRNDG